MKLKRALSLLLAGLMLGGCLASCANDGNNGDDNVGNQTTEALSEEKTQIRDNLPDNLNFEGEEINFYSFYEEGMTSGQVTVPELNGWKSSNVPRKRCLPYGVASFFVAYVN